MYEAASGHVLMPLKPESSVRVTATGRWLACLHPDGRFQRIARDDIQAVYFESGAGPFDIDWWVVEGATPGAHCVFPLGGTGDAEAVEWLKQLPGFEIKGMNSTDEARFLCWSRDAGQGATP